MRHLGNPGAEMDRPGNAVSSSRRTAILDSIVFPKRHKIWGSPLSPARFRWHWFPMSNPPSTRFRFGFVPSALRMLRLIKMSAPGAPPRRLRRLRLLTAAASWFAASACCLGQLPPGVTYRRYRARRTSLRTAGDERPPCPMGCLRGTDPAGGAVGKPPLLRHQLWPDFRVRPRRKPLPNSVLRSSHPPARLPATAAARRLERAGIPSWIRREWAALHISPGGGRIRGYARFRKSRCPNHPGTHHRRMGFHESGRRSAKIP